MSRRAGAAPIPFFACVALAAVAAVCGGAWAQSIPLSPVAQASGAQITYQYGIEFVTIDVHSNPAFTPAGQENDPVFGRGSVAEPFRIGRYEVSSGQWSQFFNAASIVSQSQGAIPYLTYAYRGSGMNLNGGITWRTAAIYCNWLHNNQALTRDAFMSGVYDVSTFGYVNAVFTDQLERSPGARFFIPNLDEWIAASHYDPNRYGPGQGGYWLWANARDYATMRGPPGVGEANWGSGNGLVPLGAYPTIQSPWGLLDTAGATSEWLESYIQLTTGDRYRFIDGSRVGYSNESDSIYSFGGEFPSFPGSGYGLRVAATVPPPSPAVVGWVGLGALLHRQRRRPSPTA